MATICFGTVLRSFFHSVLVSKAFADLVIPEYGEMEILKNFLVELAGLR